MDTDKVEKVWSVSNPVEDMPPGSVIRTTGPGEPLPKDPWVHRSESMLCKTCMYYVPKNATVLGGRERIGRCRRHAPTMSGYPVVYHDDWCGDHKLDENKN